MPLPPGLRTQFLAARHPLFAVFDGAQFDDLPTTLLRAGLQGRPLYLDRSLGGRERLITAPRLVALSSANTLVEPARLDTLLARLPMGSEAVFWECPGGEETLYRHLRGINMVRLPQPQPHSRDDPYETVLFRHADANVMAQVMSALEGQQFARVFGPAVTILFAPSGEWADGASFFIVPRPDDLPLAKPGLLQLEEEQLDAVSGARVQRSMRETANYLRRALPPQLKDMPPPL